MKQIQLNNAFKKNFNDNNLKVFALGGLGEVGKNMYVLEIGEEIIIIDSGILFPDYSYGIDYIIPDYTYLKDNESKIVGLFVTHGHEDHIGGIPYLLSAVKIPKIYAAGIAIHLIKNKLNEFANLSVNIEEFNSDSIYKFKNFEVSFFKTNHSIPDSYGIAILTKYGYVIHTGDFKFDLTPLGRPTEFYKLTNYSKKGVTLLLADSTNVKITKLSLSEKKIGDNIRSIFKHIEGRIIISTFASNVHRVSQIIEASVECGRKVIVFGRSMEKTINAAKLLNYIDAPSSTYIKAQELPHLPPNKITIICTGSQGESLAALSRIADGNHRQIKLIPGDTIIFSSSTIPGNKASINKTLNKLYKAQTNVIVNSPLTDTHTSGHASQEELRLMLSLIRPKHFMPIHGEYSMLKTHANIASDAGVDKNNCFVMENGDVLTISKNHIKCEDKVMAGQVYIDSNNTIVDSNIIKERRILADDGMVTIVFAIKGKRLLQIPRIATTGFLYTKNSSNKLLQEIEALSKQKIINFLNSHSTINVSCLKNTLNNEITNFIYEQTERKPMIISICIMN